MTSSRHVLVGRIRQIITNTFTQDPNGKDGVREHVTLQTPREMTDTQRLRLLQAGEEGRQWRT